MQENSRLDLDAIIAKLLLGVSPNLLWCTQVFLDALASLVPIGVGQW
jgi:hypothetical protein